MVQLYGGYFPSRENSDGNDSRQHATDEEEHSGSARVFEIFEMPRGASDHKGKAYELSEDEMNWRRDFVQFPETSDYTPVRIIQGGQYEANFSLTEDDKRADPRIEDNVSLQTFLEAQAQLCGGRTAHDLLRDYPHHFRWLIAKFYEHMGNAARNGEGLREMAARGEERIRKSLRPGIRPSSLSMWLEEEAAIARKTVKQLQKDDPAYYNRLVQLWNEETAEKKDL
ncbi:hypothetical protein L0Y49_03785 [bacterium]|nr:hypothetical protein [bacterium]MCI0566396.1 hypothetical protein [bacterium]